jgi:hypothetical protein
MVLIYQPPNADERISWILPRNAMAVAAVKKIYTHATGTAIRNCRKFTTNLFITCTKKIGLVDLELHDFKKSGRKNS